MFTWYDLYGMKSLIVLLLIKMTLCTFLYSLV